MFKWGKLEEVKFTHVYENPDTSEELKPIKRFVISGPQSILNT